MFDLPLFLTLIFAAIVIMKIAGVITTSWFVIFLPLFITIGIVALIVWQVGRRL